MLFAKIYFLPAGGGGMVTPAVAAKSSKFAGRRRFLTIQRTMQRFSSPRSGSPLGEASGADAMSGSAAGGGAVPACGVTLLGWAASEAGTVVTAAGGLGALLHPEERHISPATMAAKISALRGLIRRPA